WIGIVGNPNHEGPHVEALKAVGVADDQIATVHRPIGLNIGSRTPPEIAVAILAGLIAERYGRPGGVEFSTSGRRPIACEAANSSSHRLRSSPANSRAFGDSPGLRDTGIPATLIGASRGSNR